MLRKMIVLVLGVVLLGAAFAENANASTGFSFSVGTDDFYLSVGNYDYYPYTLPYNNRNPRISFHNVMGDYGSWVSISPFGQVWRPYVRAGWRPYVNGHWVYTRYGPTWVGYEPWAWAGYHYGNWIFTSRFGWVWIPGYDWHPGRVIWSHGYDTIGWMPAPPYGYDYSNGYLGYHGSHGQFDYYDDDFGYNGDDYYGGGYDDYYGGYDSGYNNPFYGSGYRNIVVNLWIFIDVNHYRHHNYADYYLDSDYTRTLFDRKLVRISSRKLERRTLERIVRQKVPETQVQEREFETNSRKVKLVTPVGEEENIRKNANRVVKNEIAPAFAEKRRNFKGLQSENAAVVNKVFKQENKQPRIKKQSVEEVLQEIDREKVQVEQKRKNLIREKTENAIRQDEAAKSRKQKEVRPGSDKGQKAGNREDQFQPKNNGKKESGFEVAEKPKTKQQADEQFKPKNKQEERELQFKQTPKPKENDFEFKPRQNEQNRAEQLDRKQVQRPVESKPKASPRDFDFERSKNAEKSKLETEEQPNEPVRKSPRVKSEHVEKQDQESVKTEESSSEDEEDGSKKKEKEDSKKKNKLDESNRKHR